MKHRGTVWLETERLILRRFTPADAETAYRNYTSDPYVTEYLTWPVHDSAETTRALLKQWTAQYKDRSFYQWAIELRSLREVIGGISVVDWQTDAEAPELGWCIGSKWWGRGLMPEAASAVMKYLFENVGVLRVTARCDAENPKSARVMEKIGMTYEGTLRAHGRNNRGIVDEVCYGILKSEFESGPASVFRRMRRSAQQLDRAECERILSEADCGVLAVIGDGGRPYAVPVNHVYRDGRLYFHCAVSGHKLDAIRRNPNVSYCVIGRGEVLPAELATSYTSVIVFGKARIASDETELRRIAGFIGIRFSADHPEEVRRETDETIASGRLCCVEIVIDHMTGKCSRDIMLERRQKA